MYYCCLNIVFGHNAIFSKFYSKYLFMLFFLLAALKTVYHFLVFRSPSNQCKQFRRYIVVFAINRRCCVSVQSRMKSNKTTTTEMMNLNRFDLNRRQIKLIGASFFILRAPKQCIHLIYLSHRLHFHTIPETEHFLFSSIDESITTTTAKNLVKCRMPAKACKIY